ncbi:uncharacterized protein LOC134643027 isoform X6 [Pelmatolapia mariae]|uniref:uncharacterized protein LOC134643027 isoform X6 n=1 Tax=Pelmatolapia mariae TaxID=158779 RepID=UPI003211D74C
MPESSLVKDGRSSSVEYGASPLRQFSQSSLLLHRNSYMLSTFCTEHNVQQCLSHINQQRQACAASIRKEERRMAAKRKNLDIRKYFSKKPVTEEPTQSSESNGDTRSQVKLDDDLVVHDCI